MLRVIVVIATLASASAFAQEVQETSQLWLMLTATGKTESGVRWYGEVQPRTNLPTRTIERILLRGAVGYQTGEKTSAWLGYAWTPLIQPSYQDEQRPFFQFLIEDPLEGAKITNRSRLEVRFISGASTIVRARHMFRVSAPVAGGFGVAASEELFVNLASTLGLDQNRVFLGVNFAPSKHVTLEAGYLHNYVWRPEPVADKVNHVAMVSAGYTY